MVENVKPEKVQPLVAYLKARKEWFDRPNGTAMFKSCKTGKEEALPAAENKVTYYATAADAGRDGYVKAAKP